MQTCLGYLIIDRTYRFVLKDFRDPNQNQISFLFIQNAPKCFPHIVREDTIEKT